jgi:hypothetical protein
MITEIGTTRGQIAVLSPPVAGPVQDRVRAWVVSVIAIPSADTLIRPGFGVIATG